MLTSTLLPSDARTVARDLPDPAGLRAWRDWGTSIVVATEDPAAAEEAERLTRFLMGLVSRALNRFDPGSDLSRVNASSGRDVRVGPLLLAALEVALEAARQTDGLVSPCLGRQLQALGYDRPLARVRQDGPGSTRLPAPPDPDAWRGVVLGEGTVRVPAGSALDLGSLGKAWAADLIAGTVGEQVGCGLVVDLGGDAAVRPTDSGTPWTVSVLDPAPCPAVTVPRPRSGHSEPATLVRLLSGGMATSTTALRRWRVGDLEHHHVVDPRSGLPTAGPWASVTATGSSCVAANTATTMALVLGSGAVRWLSDRQVDARLVSREGRATALGRWPQASTALAG